jgi:adenine phosphoribosyltransferase
MELVKQCLRSIPDFPKKGILFYDITTVLADPAAFRQVIDTLAHRYRDRGVTHIAAVESRGFIFGSALAYLLGCGLVVVRKPGKLPAETYSATYDLEYGSDSVEIHRDALAAGDKVVLVDDLIATGGTARAAAQLVKECGATIEEIAFVIELADLAGREQLAGYPVHALLTY